MKVKDVMTQEVHCVAPEASLKDVAAVLVEHAISGMPVCDGDGRVLGIVSEADILYKERGPRPRRGGREAGTETLDEPLCARVDELIRSHKRQPLLSTTGSRALIEELAGRSEGLEEAIREIALEVQKVAASQKGISDPAEAGAGDRLLGTVGETA